VNRIVGTQNDMGGNVSFIIPYTCRYSPMNTALDQEFQQCGDAANDDAAGAHASQEAPIALFPEIQTLNERELMAVLRDDAGMLDHYIGEHCSDVERCVNDLLASGIVRWELEALAIPPAYHRHFVKMSMAVLITSLYARNYCKVMELNAPLAVAAPLCHLVDPKMISLDGSSSLRMSVVFQVAVRLAADVTHDLREGLTLRERFFNELNRFELTYSEHLNMIGALDRFLAMPSNQPNPAVVKQ
jgi:hypothetical protein